MSSGITFTDKQEAREYMTKKHDEGYVSAMQPVESGYKVRIIGTIKEYEKRAMGLYKEGKIILPHHTSTRTRLHELGHKVYGHKPRIMGTEELARYEIEAESYAYEKMGKSINYKVGIPALLELMYYKKDPEVAIGIVVRELSKKGIEVSLEDQIWLKDYAKTVTD